MASCETNLSPEFSLLTPGYWRRSTRRESLTPGTLSSYAELWGTQSKSTSFLHEFWIHWYIRQRIHKGRSNCHHYFCKVSIKEHLSVKENSSPNPGLGRLTFSVRRKAALKVGVMDWGEQRSPVTGGTLISNRKVLIPACPMVIFQLCHSIASR